MRYHSTRGRAPLLTFDQVLLTGLATDGGLYLPIEWPRLSKADLKAMAGQSYEQVATRVMTPFLGGAVAEADFAAMVTETYEAFAHKAVAPLIQLDRNDWLLELFHGPTLSFKDYALQLVGRLFDVVLKRQGRRATIVGATSGDTGSAAIEACRDKNAIEIVMLHPKGRVSEVQRRQMTTVLSPNVHNVAIDGSFDDCQDLVKALFADETLREDVSLAAVNSINWARIMAQIVYYVAAATALGAPDREIAFAVPTGNFGNVYAALGARRMGVPISQLVIGSNANDILTRFIDSGEMRLSGVVPTLAPSMDIQVSSNFERYLFDLFEGNAKDVTELTNTLRTRGFYSIGPNFLSGMKQVFDGHRLDDAGTLKIMAELFRESGNLIDPHSAIGVAAGRAKRRDRAIPMVAVATAHPAKFPDAVERATGVRPALPPALADLLSRPERLDELPNDLGAVEAYLRRAAKRTV